MLRQTSEINMDIIQQLIHRFLRRRHFWRHATFGEIAELYTSRLMTVFALKFVMTFASVYLYKIGYSVTQIALFWALYYGVKSVVAIAAGYLVARIGPKHGTLIANVLFAVSLCFLLLAEQFGVGMVIVWSVVQGFAGTLNNVSYLTDFSKVKHSNHAGKEIGFMNVVEKVGAGISPLVGGAIASLFGPVWSILLPIVMFLLSTVPLFHTAEPVKTHQKITIEGFPWRRTWRSMRAKAAFGTDVVASGVMWVLFISIAVFPNDGDELYVKIGAFTSISLVVALAASYTFGKVVDRNQGLLLLRSSVVANSFLHLLRPTVSTSTGIILTNAVNEAVYTGYSLAFMRGEFDLADTPGFRIVYLTLTEIAANMGATLATLFVAGAALLYGELGGLSVFYVAVALVTLLIAVPRFPLYAR
jgi:MFS family permease